MTVVREGKQPEGLMTRVLGGQQLYWHVLSITGGKRQIFVSGQVPRDKNGNVVGKGDMAAQIERVGENIKMCLEAAGATLDDLVKITSFTTDIDEFFKHSAVRNRYFGKALPASTAVEVRRLAHPDWMIEIEATAIV
ncbi:MAG: RidA family protein [Xanthobacteraceae bacterium]|nr:RidA family protein [Xanthobacteraceae bacterium]MBX9843852.1 RidA family protein [Xanthobacteraceae bacterium]